MYRPATFEEVMGRKLGLLLIVVAIIATYINIIRGEVLITVAMILVMIDQSILVFIKSDNEAKSKIKNKVAHVFSYTALLIVVIAILF